MISSRILFRSYGTLHLRETKEGTHCIAAGKCFVQEVGAGVWRLAGKSWKALRLEGVKSWKGF